MHRERDFPPFDRNRPRHPHPEDRFYHRPFPLSPDRRPLHHDPQHPGIHHPRFRPPRPENYNEGYAEEMGGPNENYPPNVDHESVRDHSFQGPRPEFHGNMEHHGQWEHPPHHNQSQMDFNEQSKQQYNDSMSEGNAMFFDENGEPIPMDSVVNEPNSNNFHPRNNSYNESFPHEQGQRPPGPRMRGRGFPRGRPGFHNIGRGRGMGRGDSPRFIEPNSRGRGEWRGRGGSPSNNFRRGRGRPPLL